MGARQYQTEIGGFVGEQGARQYQTEIAGFLSETQSGASFNGLASTGGLVLSGAVPVLNLNFAGTSGSGGLILTGTVPTLVASSSLTRQYQTETGGAFVSERATKQYQTEVMGAFFAATAVQSYFSGVAPGGALALAGHVPTLTRSNTGNFSGTPGAGDFVLGGDPAPTLSRGSNTNYTGSPAQVPLIFQGQQLDASNSPFQGAPAGPGQIVLGGANPILTQGTAGSDFTGSPTAGSYVLIGVQPIILISGGFDQTPTPGQMVLSGTVPSLTLGGNFDGVPQPANLILGGQQGVPAAFFGVAPAGQLILNGAVRPRLLPGKAIQSITRHTVFGIRF